MKAAILIVGATAILASSAYAQQRGGGGAAAPATHENLKVLPPDIPQPQLLQTMQGFAQGLGVQCGYCHASAPAVETPGRGGGGRGRGPAAPQFNFASDEKPAKKAAREMMLIVRDLNARVPAAVGKSADAAVRVQCMTCHHGVAIPRQLPEILAQTAISQAESGADIIAPSGMMDGMVAAIRAGLDAAGFTHIPILSYAVKYASAFYGPFREAADSAPQFGDRRGYQMDPPNVREALREAALDIEQGADMLMVKPALPYLDVLRAARERFDLPLAAYQVSGEYAQIKAAGRLGWIDEERVMMESLIGIKRAGADLILTYFAKDVIKRL